MEQSRFGIRKDNTVELLRGKVTSAKLLLHGWRQAHLHAMVKPLALDTATGSEVYSLNWRGKIVEIIAIRLSSQGPSLLLSSDGKSWLSRVMRIQFWGHQHRQRTAENRCGTTFYFSLSSDERLLAAWRMRGDVKVWDVRTGNRLFDVHWTPEAKCMFFCRITIR